ncbi:alanine racemase [Ectobacillus antri]|jgi:alanine racemase|uniref:Alanine racemase n=1 Tax=Ectobacillus antri TaxID=2486280 RepID=A0ABT6H7G7_9BACI|nr:alanine racemase [Ectobacillus antri]MDG4657911.1 alanine racemase [Ectobacillus antri]MDG5755005.1 alanine racemase [Ectobacillus antri]
MSRSFYRDTWVEVDLDAISHNVQCARKYIPDAELIAVVKANAYGHGDAPVARAALDAGASRLAVAFLDEAISLREAGIDAPILVLGATRPEDVNLAAAHRIALTVFQQDWIEQAKQFWSSEDVLQLHLKLDSGMGRVGIRTEEELSACIQSLQSAPYFDLEGVFTHFATADELDTSYFVKQKERFENQINWLTKHHINPRLIHCSNSAAALRFPECRFNAVRIGIAMYGLTPSPEIRHLLPYPLQEAFSFHSKLVHVKRIESGESVSYGATYTTEKDEWIGTVPVGYADGWIRKLQGFEVLVDGVRVPIVGRVCMDQMMIRLPYDMPIGTQVTLIGRQKEENVSVDDVASYLDTINYEVPCMVNFRVPRVFRQNGKIVEIENLLTKQ